MPRIILAVPIALGLLLGMACGVDEPWEEDDRLKPRDEYCYRIEVDPIRSRNAMWGWTDQAPVVSGQAVVAKDVRVASGHSDRKPYKDDDDYFAALVYWTAGSEGYIDVRHMCEEKGAN